MLAKSKMRRKVVLVVVVFTVGVLIIFYMIAMSSTTTKKLEAFDVNNDTETIANVFDIYDLESIDKIMDDSKYNGKITFIHIPKTGGVSITSYLESYEKYFNVLGHYEEHISSDEKKYLVVIREPLDRFKSIYQYWRQNCLKDGLCDSNASVKMFISYIKEGNVAMLHVSNIDDVHYLPQCQYIENTDYFSNMLVIMFDKSTEAMEAKMLDMLTFLHIPVKDGVKLEHKNVSDTSEHSLDEEDMAFLTYYYSDDFILWGKLNNEADLFWHVF